LILLLSIVVPPHRFPLLLHYSQGVVEARARGNAGRDLLFHGDGPVDHSSARNGHPLTEASRKKPWQAETSQIILWVDGCRGCINDPLSRVSADVPLITLQLIGRRQLTHSFFHAQFDLYQTGQCNAEERNKESQVEQFE